MIKAIIKIERSHCNCTVASPLSRKENGRLENANLCGCMQSFYSNNPLFYCAIALFELTVQDNKYLMIKLEVKRNNHSVKTSRYLSLAYNIPLSKVKSALFAHC